MNALDALRNSEHLAYLRSYKSPYQFRIPDFAVVPSITDRAGRVLCISIRSAFRSFQDLTEIAEATKPIGYGQPTVRASYLEDLRMRGYNLILDDTTFGADLPDKA